MGLARKPLAFLLLLAVGSAAFAPTSPAPLATSRAPEAAFHAELVTLAAVSESAFHPKPSSRAIHRDFFGVLSASEPRLPTAGVRDLETLPGAAFGPSPAFTPNARAPPRAG
ncbi:MAG: hypothetical protein JST04_07530 [Bdellovibrionales bacterium]|nr:hypothetical protein [Bdellovibrionales bacterium]